MNEYYNKDATGAKTGHRMKAERLVGPKLHHYTRRHYPDVNPYSKGGSPKSSPLGFHPKDENEEVYPDKNYFGLSKARKRDDYYGNAEQEQELNKFGQIDYKLEDELKRYKEMSAFDKLHNKRHDFQIPLAVASYDGVP